MKRFDHVNREPRGAMKHIEINGARVLVDDEAELTPQQIDAISRMIDLAREQLVRQRIILEKKPWSN